MEVTIVFLAVAVILVFYLAAFKQDIKEQFLVTEDTITNDYNNVDLALNKIIEKGDVVANSVTPRDETPCTFEKFENYNLEPVEKVSMENFVKDSQYMFENGDTILTKYNKNYYHDWRFPAQPVEVEFAKNPEEYIKKYPKRYPSYVYENKDEIMNENF